jgi:hypothetical protein
MRQNLWNGANSRVNLDVGTDNEELRWALLHEVAAHSVGHCQLSQAKENLAKLTDEVELAVETAYNSLTGRSRC